MKTIDISEVCIVLDIRGYQWLRDEKDIPQKLKEPSYLDMYGRSAAHSMNQFIEEGFSEFIGPIWDHIYTEVYNKAHIIAGEVFISFLKDKFGYRVHGNAKKVGQELIASFPEKSEFSEVRINSFYLASEFAKAIHPELTFSEAEDLAEEAATSMGDEIWKFLLHTEEFNFETEVDFEFDGVKYTNEPVLVTCRGITFDSFEEMIYEELEFRLRYFE